MYSDFIDYGWKNIENDVEKLYSGMDPTYKTPVLISTWQSLENQDKDFFADFQGVIVDECHGTKANVVSRLLKQCLSADYKIGTTGTLPTETADQLMINGVLGNVIYELKSKQLIELGYLTKIVVASIFIKYPEEFITAGRSPGPLWRIFPPHAGAARRRSDRCGGRWPSIADPRYPAGAGGGIRCGRS